MSKFPYTQKTPLVNDIIATTEVTIQSGMQVATTTYTSAAGDLGFIVLSPVTPVRTNVRLHAGRQQLLIDEATFHAAFGFSPGYVKNVGTATNQEGEDPTNFSKNIASWTAPE